MRARYEIFRSTFETWPALFEQAAEFATRIGQDKVISISHSEDKNDGVVVVWYWEADTPIPLSYRGQTPIPVATFEDFGDGIRGPDVADLIDQGSDDEEEVEEDKK